jgi:hypothetical protein
MAEGGNMGKEFFIAFMIIFVEIVELYEPSGKVAVKLTLILYVEPL